jgi:hypothetical protein
MNDVIMCIVISVVVCIDGSKEIQAIMNHNGTQSYQLMPSYFASVFLLYIFNQV